MIIRSIIYRFHVSLKTPGFKIMKKQFNPAVDVKKPPERI